MTSLEYGYIVKELQSLVEKRFRKFYFIRGNLYRMKIGEADIVCEPGVRLHITKYLEESDDADNLTQKMRKELENAKVLAIRQLNNDRVVVFEFADGLNLYFEMFAKGNIILVKDGKTVMAMREEHWADREIAHGKPYCPPKSSTVEKLEAVLSEKYIVACMMKLPLGKEYAKEILQRCDIKETRPGNSLTESQVGGINKQISDIKKKQKPYLFKSRKEGRSIEYGLVIFSGMDAIETESQEKKSLSEALDEYYNDQSKEGIDPETEKLIGRLKKQEERLAELNAMENELKTKGDYINKNYEKIEEVLKIASSNPEKLEKYNVKTDKKEKKIEIEI